MTHIPEMSDEEEEAVGAEVGNGMGDHDEKTRPRASRARKST